MIKVYKEHANLATFLFGGNDFFRTVENVGDSDLVMMPGGSDWNPKYYKHSKHSYTNYIDSVDELQMKTLSLAKKHKIFTIGICRGAQGLTISAGGVLIQHVTGHANGDHQIYFKNNNNNAPVIVTVNSMHHQMCWPYVMPPGTFEIIGYSRADDNKMKGSRVYEFGPDEHIDYNTIKNGNSYDSLCALNFKEPEVIYYPKIGGYAIQCHPEMMGKAPEYQPFLHHLRWSIIDKFNQFYSKEFNYLYDYFFECEYDNKDYIMTKANAMNLSFQPPVLVD